MRRRLITVVTALLVLAGAVATPAGAQEDDPPEYANPKVMTLNLYVGADLQSFDPALILGSIVATNFRERAATIAEEIDDRNPDLIGLQEVSNLFVTAPTDGVCNRDKLGPLVTEGPFGIAFDYLDILEAALVAEGEDYFVAAEVTNARVSLPILDSNGAPIACGNLIDRDVTLARSSTVELIDDQYVENPRSGNYDVNYQLPFLPDPPLIEFTRGWTEVDVEVRGSTLTFANTHLEVEPDLGTSPPAGLCGPLTNLFPCQIPQAQELVGVLADNPYPTILVGDFNSEPGSGLGYDVIAGAGFVDAWDIRLLGIAQQENTCCQDPDLLNLFSNLPKEDGQRIDIVFIRVDSEPTSLSTVVFDRFWEKTPSGLWPTDHGSVVSRLIYPKP